MVNKNLAISQRKFYKKIIIVSVAFWLFSFVLLVMGNDYSLAGVILGTLSFFSVITASIKYMRSSKQAQTSSSFGELTLIAIIILGYIFFSLFNNFATT